MSGKTIKENMQAYAVKKALGYIEGNWDKNIPKLMAQADKFDSGDRFVSQRRMLHRILEDPVCNLYKLIKSM